MTREPRGRIASRLGPKLLLGIPLTLGFVWLFLWAGSGLSWRRGWGVLGVILVGETLRTIWVARRNPEVLRRRGEVGPGTPTWDKAWLAGFGLLILVTFVVGALDGGRYRWAPLPDASAALGLMVYALHVWGISWAMGQNPHFEKTVRIQRDRDHAVIDTGPYALVRHPGYVAAMLGFGFAPPLLLGSGLALIPGVLVAA